MHNHTYGKKYLHYQTSRGLVRVKIKNIYLNNIKKYLSGLTIDFGCGIGQLLKLLPVESLGLEINTTAVDYCRKQNLNVELYLPDIDDYSFKNIKSGVYKNFIMSHVLEHIEDASEIFKKIIKSCKRMGIEKIVLVVPGYKGYLSDNSHRTYINRSYLVKNNIVKLHGYHLRIVEYFPFNIEMAGNIFTHNESIFVYEK